MTRTAYITAGSVSSATTRVITYTYDYLYRLTGANYSTGESFAYAYDPVGNRTAQTRTLTSTTVISYVYDAANRLTSVNGVGYTWDNNPLRYAAGTSRQLNKRWSTHLRLRRRQPADGRERLAGEQLRLRRPGQSRLAALAGRTAGPR